MRLDSPRVWSLGLPWWWWLLLLVALMPWLDGQPLQPPKTWAEVATVIGVTIAALVFLYRILAWTGTRVSPRVRRLVAASVGVLSLRYQTPMWWRFGKARLQKEATALARDIYANVKSQPVAPFSDPEWDAMNDAIATAGPVQANLNEAQMAIWRAYTQRSAERVLREEQAFAERFGSRIAAVLYEYRRLGLLSDDEAQQIRILTRLPFRRHEAAQRIDALAKR
jgi:hypothetical protein